jgi:alkanesulfonate monooxygenase SsuD/methylene tetrahydromethanopterin reductase-like flavin-dependent oxidoreductase (luciferase family)
LYGLLCFEEDKMRFGISLPPFADFADARFLAEITREAEALGWDGVFIWDHVFFDPTFHPNVDPWAALAVMAYNTSTIRLGTMVTPVARRRAWVLARQTVAVDRLSNGRLTLGVGLGDPAQWDFGFFGEPTDAKIRAQMLDEGLDVLCGLWTGKPFSFDGQYNHVRQMIFRPSPVQSPRIPIWVGGNWPNKAPMRRAARFDGFYPIKWDGGMTPDTWREALAYIRQHRTLLTPFDAAHGGCVPDDLWHKATPAVEPFAEVGVTWWIEDVSPWRFGASWEEPWKPEHTQRMVELIRRGPPRV